jgi:ABC-2 type transport system permease protein
VSTFVRELAAEYRRIFLDPGAVLILVGALVIYAFFYPTPYRAQVLKDVPVVVVDEDQTDLSRRLVRMVDAHELTGVTAQMKSMAEAEVAVRAGQAGGILVVPADFERRVKRGEQAFVTAYTDASYFLIYRQVLTAVVESTGTLSAGIEVRRLIAGGVPADRAMKARDPLPLVMRPLFNPTEGYAGYVVPAVLVLILQQTLLVGIGLVRGTVRERDGKAAVPAQPGDGEASNAAFFELLGRALAYYSVYVVHGLFYFGVVFHLYGFPQLADARTLFLFGTPFLLSVIFLGLTLSTLFRSREMAIQVLLFSSLPALFLSGFAWPVESLPRWLAAFARALPSTTAIPGFLRLTEMGATLADVRAEWMTLWVACGVYFALAWISSCIEWPVERRNYAGTGPGSRRWIRPADQPSQ